MTESEAFKKIAYYCAYRERSLKETQQKLDGFELEPEVSERLIARLKEDKYLDEKRFAESYVGGKFRVKKWGRIKIKVGLKSHGVSNEMIRNALQTIPDDAYESTLEELFESKMKDLKKLNSATDKQKMYNYLCSKGFEHDLVIGIIQKVG